MSFLSTTIEKRNGVPTIVVDGKPIHGMTATSCAFDDPAVIEDFTRAGVDVMMIWIEAGISCNPGPGLYDWSYAEERLKRFEQHSGDTRWVIRIRLGLLHDWFRRAHPSEVCNPASAGDPAGVSVCHLVSPVWRKHVEELLTAFVGWLKTTRWAPRIIGFMLNAGRTEEWLPFDADELSRGVYPAVYARELRAWLRRGYNNDVTALRKAWNDPGVSFDNATPPGSLLRSGSHTWGPFSLRNPATDRPAIDYYLFLNHTLADCLIDFCKVAKEAAGTPIICGGFHSYLWWETGVYSYIQEYGHGLIQKLNESPWIDFISDITSYDGRYPGGPSGYLGLPNCQNLHNKLHYTEVDLKTYTSLSDGQRAAWKKVIPNEIPLRTAMPAIPDRDWTWDAGFCGRDEDEQIAVLQREHMHNLITGTAYWWFDIPRYAFHPPCLVEAISRLSRIGRDALTWDRSSISEVAFVCSEDTPMRQANMNGTCLRFEMEPAHPLLLDLATRGFGSAGIPFDIYELNDLAHPDFPGDQYKLIVFLNCAYVNDKAAAGIRRWQNGKRTLLWTFAPAVMNDEKLDPALGDALRGIKLGWRNKRRNIHLQFDKRSRHPLAKGGAALDFGTEGSIGPIFFADDPDATNLATLRDGGESACAVREHGAWNSAYLAMLNFGPALMRNFTRFAGAHVWCETDDVVYANQSMVCLHTASAGEKTVKLPAPAFVTDLWTGQRTTKPTDRIHVKADAYRTWAWRVEYVRENHGHHGEVVASEGGKVAVVAEQRLHSSMPASIGPKMSYCRRAI